MKQFRLAIGLIAILIAPFIGAAQAAAYSQTTVQEVHVTAIVPAHRDIILDTGGNIEKIISNTPDDITPTVYLLNDNPANKRPLSDDIYAAYRQYVPVGTAKYGVLYQRSFTQAVFVPKSVTQPFVALHARTDIAFLLNNYHPVL